VSWDFQPLRVTAYLRSNICGNDPFFPLDGILQTKALWDEYGEGFRSLPDPKMRLVYPSDDSMPVLKRHADSPYWYYACSFAIYETQAEEVQYWHKRFRDQYADLVDFGKRSAKVNLASGPYRGYRMPLRTFVVAEMTWYLVGDLAGVERLLQRARAIGKKRAYGNGEVLKWEVETTDQDLSEQAEGVWTRAVPAILLKNHLLDMTYHAYRPPYWHAENMALCVMPGSEVIDA